MARELIVDQEFAFSGGECYGDPFGLVLGEKYTVMWGDEEFPNLTAVQASLYGMDVVVIGNLVGFDGPDTGEPFLLGDTVGTGAILAYDTTITTKRVAIYKNVAEKVGIVLKDRDGNPDTHFADAVRLLMSDGSTPLFVNADDIPEPVSLTVAADFTNNEDMVLTPDAGKQFSQVTVTKPIDLTAANIPEGLFIGGVGPGEFKGGGGDGNAKMAFGKITPQSTVQTITHGLGVVPDMIIVTFDSPKQGYSGTIREFIGFSRSFWERNSISGRPSRNLSYYSSAVTARNTTHNSFMEELGSTTTNYLWGVNDETFKVPVMDSVHTYFWIAIAGLT